MRSRQISYEEAYAIVKKARYFIRPNDGFIAALRAYQEELCELCALRRRTKWFDEFCTEEFAVLECDQCDDPLVVYRQHARDL